MRMPIANPFDTESAMTGRSVARSLFWLVFVAVLALGCGKKETKHCPAIDATAPVTVADPPGGTHSSAVSVRLISNEPSTIYYTTDGREPTVSDCDGTGASPLSGIVISSDTTLRFFGVDMAGNEEAVRTEEYVVTGSENNPPTAVFSANPLFSYGPVTIDFDASPSSDPDGDSLTYEWNFGDGQTDMGETVSHYFPQLGVCHVTLTVTDTKGLSNTIRKPVGVLENMGNRKGYLNPSEILEIVINTAHEYSTIAVAEMLGKTFEGRPIMALKVSDNVRNDESAEEPIVCFEGGIHAREPLSWEVVADIVKYLTEGYASDAQVQKWVNNTEIWVVPCLNPDGVRYAIEQYDGWRKNRHGPGVDINRNWHFMWDDSHGGSTSPGSLSYRGPYPDSEAETQAMLAFNWRERFVFEISYHTFMSGGHVYYPYGTSAAAKAEPALISEIAGGVRSGGGIDSASYAPAAGGEIDTQFYEFGTVCVAVELGGGSFWPSYESGMQEVRKRRGAWQYLLDRASGPLLYGSVTDTDTGEPLVAQFHVEDMDMSPNGETPGCFLGERRYTKPNGTYWKVLTPGDYTVTFTREGYKPREINISIGEAPKKQNVQLEKDLNSANQKPTASFSVSKTTVKQGEDVVFDASNSSDPDSDPLTYSWTFGDGDRREAEFNHSTADSTYVFKFDVDPGTYLVVLEVDDGNGAGDRAFATVIVEK